MQLATSVDEAQGMRFNELTSALGTTPSDALRMFVSAFNASRGFPYDVRLVEERAEPFASEEEADEFLSDLSRRLLDEAW